MSDENEIDIRPAETVDDYRACQEAQRRAWGITEDEYIVPIATMVGAQLHGGLVLGAFLPDGTAAGVSFAFLGRIDGRLGLYSQLTGVVPGRQGQGIGHLLKQAQWRIARERGLELLAWAFDPLQAGNAHFNLGRLGARAHSYIPNMYGPRTDALNAGVPTDRLIAVWSTTPQPHAAIGDAELARLPRVVEAVARPDGLPDVDVATPPADPEAGPSSVLLEIPGEIGRLRAEAPERAERWRRALASTLPAYFAAGFAAVDFVRPKDDNGTHHYYVLRREASPSR